MNGLPEFDPQGEIGRQVNATRLNALVGGLRGGKLQPSKGMRTTQTAGGTTSVPIVKRYPTSATPPFWPRFKPSPEDAATDWVVTISKGIVSDNATTDGDAHPQYELLDLIDADGNPTEFPIVAGQGVYVTYGVDDKGAVKTDAEKPRISIGAATAETSHYDPPAGVETSGDPGTVNRLLAIFDVDTDGNPIPEMFEAGNNIEHWRDLPLIKTMGGETSVVRDFDLASGMFRLRGLTAGLGITLTENNDDIEIKADGGGWWGDATISYTPAVGSTDYITFRIEAGIVKKIFRLSGEIPGDEDTPGATDLGIVDTDT